MLDYGTNRTKQLIRALSSRLYAERVRNTEVAIEDALAYFERRTDTDAVREAYKGRIAIGIRKERDGDSWETYTKGRAAQRVDNGELEIITIGTGGRIVDALATLFTNETASWDWQTDVDEEQQPDEEAAAAIQEQRTLGGFDIEMADSDAISVAVESGPLYVDYFGGHLSYRAFSPGCLYAKFGEYILDNGHERGIDYRNLEDASVVVVKLSSTRHDGGGAHEKNQYVAFFGRSNLYPQGRRVTYAADRWESIPNVGDDPTAIEWRDRSGAIGNPLTWYANKFMMNSDSDRFPEYPIVIMRGGLSRTSGELLPVSTSLYESCLEIDVTMSRLLHDAMLSARGIDVITSEQVGTLPRCLEGAVALRRGQKLEIMGQPIGNAQGAMEITKDMIRAIAEGRGVPGYMVFSAPGMNPESGIALIVRTQPLIANRNHRIKLNRPQVDRLWQIERGLYATFTGKPLGSEKTKQIWNPGRIIVPETETEKVTRLTTAMDAKLIDYVRAVRDYHNFATDKDAIDFIEKMQDPERTQYAPAKAEGPMRGINLGLFGKKPATSLPGEENAKEKEAAKLPGTGGAVPPPPKGSTLARK